MFGLSDQSDGRGIQFGGTVTAKVLVFAYPESTLPVGVSMFSGVIAGVIPQAGSGIVLGITSKTGFLGPWRFWALPEAVNEITGVDSAVYNCKSLIHARLEVGTLCKGPDSKY